ncbi:uncharacterized protein [Procambarus clarkii]|uniref:uncharacterized protein isoform X2 n=1 Tax=Procambarus clarkii TaxID=6728 RepID=UPI003742ADE6
MEEFSAPSLQGVIRLRVTGTDNDGVTQCSFRQELQQFTACKPWNSVFEVLCYPHMRERGRGIEITARNTRNWLEVEDIITWKRLRKTFRIEGIPRTNLYIEATWHELVSQVGLLPMSERGVRVGLNVGEKFSIMANSTEYPKDQERKLTIFERGYDYLITSLHEQKLKIVAADNDMQEQEQELSFLLHEPHLRSIGKKICFNNGASITLNLSFNHLTR